MGGLTPCKNLVCKEWDVTVVETAAMLMDISHDGNRPLAASGEGPIKSNLLQRKVSRLSLPSRIA